MTPLELKVASFNTQPREGGWEDDLYLDDKGRMFQHTAARRRLPENLRKGNALTLFQHTAARRRLLIKLPQGAAIKSFNTQPREGGCSQRDHASVI